MKKLFILSFLFGGMLQIASAQSFTIAPNDTVVDVAPPGVLTIFDIYQRNISGDTITLGWTKVYESIPSGWDYSLCDHGTCYPGFPTGGTMSAVTPPDSGFLGVNVMPYTIPGTLTVRFYVYETSAPSQGDTLTWIITLQSTGIEDLATANFSMYPNPASDYLQVKTANIELPASIAVYDMNGKSMLRTNLMQQNETIDIMALPVGTYILEVQGKQIIRKTFIKK